MVSSITYEIVTVDYDPTQTKPWRYWVERNCPTARIVTIPDTKPYPWCWSGSKVKCFAEKFETDRVVYLDTDTIVTRDLGEVFELMDDGDDFLGISQRLKPNRLVGNTPHRNEMPAINEKFKPHFPYPNTSSGMVVCNGMPANLLYDMWNSVMEDPTFQRLLGRHYTAEEYALSIACARDFPSPQYIWDLPHEIHCNIFHGSIDKGKADLPMVIHYHRAEWAKRHKFQGNTLFDAYIKDHV